MTVLMYVTLLTTLFRLHCQRTEQSTAFFVQEAEARMKVLIAVSQGPVCGNQDNSAAVVMRSVMFACLRDGFFANSEAGDAQYAYKLHSAVLAKVGAHARDTMDQLGHAGQDISDLLNSYECR